MIALVLCTSVYQVCLSGSEERSPPEQLPIVLQVLLSNVHRMRALELLGRFLDLGPWAVNLALSVGIFPYVLKLLQSFAKELRPLLVFIWAKILAVDDVSIQVRHEWSSITELSLVFSYCVFYYILYFILLCTSISST